MSKDKKTNLLKFIIELCEKKYKELLPENLKRDLKNVLELCNELIQIKIEKGEKIEIIREESIYSTISTLVKELEKELIPMAEQFNKNIERDENDEYVEKMTKFKEYADMEIKKYLKEVDNIKKRLIELADYYHEHELIIPKEDDEKEKKVDVRENPIFGNILTFFDDMKSLSEKDPDQFFETRSKFSSKIKNITEGSSELEIVKIIPPNSFFLKIRSFLIEYEKVYQDLLNEREKLKKKEMDELKKKNKIQLLEEVKKKKELEKLQKRNEKGNFEDRVSEMKKGNFRKKKPLILSTSPNDF
jgi:hypothetical protein